MKKLRAQEHKCAWVEGKEIKKRRWLLPDEFLALDGVLLNCFFWGFSLPVFKLFFAFRMF